LKVPKQNPYISNLQANTAKVHYLQLSTTKMAQMATGNRICILVVAPLLALLMLVFWVYAAIVQPLTETSTDGEGVGILLICGVVALFYIPKAIAQYAKMAGCAIRGEEIDWNTIERTF